MAEYISREEAIKELREVYENEYPTASGDFDEYASHDVPNVLRNMKAADVQPVISGDNCIVCGRNVHKDDVYYDVNGGTICEACMNTKCKCKNGR